MTGLRERTAVWPARAVGAVTAVLVVANAALIVAAVPDLQPGERAIDSLGDLAGLLYASIGLLNFVRARNVDPASTGYGTGLQGMADRLDVIGGTMKVTSAAGAGTTVTGRVPTAVVS